MRGARGGRIFGEELAAQRGLAHGTPPACRSGVRAAVGVLRCDVAAAAAALHGCLRAIDGAGHASGSAASHVLRATAVEAAERGDVAAADALAAWARQACARFDANTTPVVVVAADAAGRAARHVSDPAGRAVADTRVSLQRGDRRGARAALERADLGALADGLPARALQERLLQAAAADTRARADRALVNAVDLAAEHGLVGSLLADAPDVDRLLSVGGPGAVHRARALDLLRPRPIG